MAPSLQRYAAGHLDSPVPDDYAVRFMAYDWRVNHQP